MSMDTFHVESILLQGLTEPLAVELPPGLHLEHIAMNAPLSQHVSLQCRFIADTPDPILTFVRQCISGAVMTFRLADRRLRGVVTSCTADHLAADFLPDHDWLDRPVLEVTIDQVRIV